MRLDIKEVAESKYNGQIVYVCDIRQPDLNKKPIRKVLPTKVLVRPNSEVKDTIYYSESHFVELGKDGQPKSKIIKPYDNTGFRSYTGEPLNVFTTMEEAIECFNFQCDEIISRWKQKKEVVLKEIDDSINDLINLKK